MLPKKTIPLFLAFNYLLFLCTLSKSDRTVNAYCKYPLYGREYFQLDTTTIPSPDIEVTMWFQSSYSSGILLVVTGHDNVWNLVVAMVNGTIR